MLIFVDGETSVWITFHKEQFTIIWIMVHKT